MQMFNNKKNESLYKYLDELMVPIVGGPEILRDYKDEQKWISSNSKMSLPGVKGNLL